MESSGTPGAAQVSDTLRKCIAYLAPGLHNRGGPIIVLPSIQNAALLQPQEITTTLQYLSALPDAEVRNSGFLVVIDNREQCWKQLKVLYALIQQTLGASTGGVYLVAVLKRDEQLFEKAKRQLSLRPASKRLEYGFDVVKISASKLQQHAARGALPVELGGLAPYNHEIWIQTRIRVESFLEATNAARDAMTQAEKDARAGSLNVRAPRFVEAVFTRPSNLLDRGRALLSQLRTDRNSQFSVADAYDQVRMCTLTVSACESLSSRIAAARQRVDATLSQPATSPTAPRGPSFANPNQFNQNTAQGTRATTLNRASVGATLDRFVPPTSGPSADLSRLNVDELINSSRLALDTVRRDEPAALLTLADGSSLIGTSARAADDARRAFDAAELRFADCFAKFSTLRAVVQSLASPSPSPLRVTPPQQAALRGVHEQLETAMRRLAKRLDARRALHEQAARFYRSVSESQRRLDAVMELICADSLRDDTVARARELLAAFESAVRDCDASVQNAITTGTALLGALQAEMATISPDSMEANAMRNGIVGDQQNVRLMLEAVTDRQKRAAELGEVRRLKLEQLNQLRTCEDELEKALRCIAELRRTATLKRGESGRTAFDTEQVRAAHTELEKGSLGAFRLAKQLVQTAMMLRKALRLDSTKCEQHAETLNILWKDLAFAIEDESNRIDLTMEFNQNADNILQRVEALLIRLGRAEEGQQPDAFMRFLEQHKPECEYLNEQFGDLQKQATTVLAAAQSAAPNVAEPPAAQSARIKMSTIEYKLRELNGYWSGSLSLQRARRARSVPSQSLNRTLGKSLSQLGGDQLNVELERSGRSSSQAAARSLLGISQLAEPGNNVHFSTGHVTTITQVTRQVTEQAALSAAQAKAQNVATTLTVPVSGPQRNADLDSIMAQLREDS